MDVERSNGAVKTAFDIQVDGKHGPERPKMTWKQLTKRDCREWKLSAINPHDRHTWRSGVRSAMRAANQLSGRGPTGVDVALYLHINQKSDYDMNMMMIPKEDECPYYCQFGSVALSFDHFQSHVGFMHMLNMYSCHGASFEI